MKLVNPRKNGIKHVVCKIVKDLSLVINGFVYIFFSNLICENLKAGRTTGHFYTINIFIHLPRQSVHEVTKARRRMRMFELQNSTPNVYYRRRGCDGLASFTPHDIVCKCLIIENAERPAFLREPNYNSCTKTIKNSTPFSA